MCQQMFVLSHRAAPGVGLLLTTSSGDRMGWASGVLTAQEELLLVEATGGGASEPPCPLCCDP